MRLICVGTAAGPDEYGPAWRSGLAPQIEVVTLALAGRDGERFRPGELAGLLDDRPYAVFGRGPSALAALEVSRVLSQVRIPAQLQVAACPVPGGPAGVISWPVTAFAAAGPGPGQAGGMAGWRSVTTGQFTLRLLDPAAGNLEEQQQDGWADAGTLLAIKEELRLWPE
jgi:surfactin synthase thioesterase subunit